MVETQKISLETLLARIEERRRQLNISERQVSLAGGSEYVIRDIRRGKQPGIDKLLGIAARLQTSTEWLIGGGDAAAPPEKMPASEVSLADNVRRFRTPGGNDLPIHGTAQGQDISFDGNGGARIEQTMLDPSETIRYIRRPEALLGVDKAYAVYIQGDSMAPRWEPGDLAVVDPRREPNIGDDVIVQLTGEPDEFGDSRVVSVLIKRLMRRSASFVDLLQYQPECTFRVDKTRIAAMHRIVRMADLLGA